MPIPPAPRPDGSRGHEPVKTPSGRQGLMTRIRLTEADHERIVQLREAGRTMGQIASVLGCSASTVSWHCLRLAAEPPKPQRPRVGLVSSAEVFRNGHVVRRYTTEEDERLLALEAEGLSLSEIGRRLGRRHNSIRARLMTLARRDARLEACR